MDVGHQRAGRKNLDLRSRKTGAGPSIPEESITTLEATIQTEGEAGVDFKIDLCIACFMKEIQITRQGTVLSSLNPKGR
jgi:hypothetical protein